VAVWGHAASRRAAADADPRVSRADVDLLRAASLDAALAAAPPSAIFHLAGFADVNAAWRASAQALRVNALGTHHLLGAAARRGPDVPVLVVSSALVYRSSPAPIDEGRPLAPSTPYGMSKLAQEMTAAHSRCRRVFVARPFNHAGPRQSDAYVTSGFARQIAEIEAGVREPVLRVGNLESRRDLTDVRDTVRAYRLIVERGQPGRPYNVCSGRAHRIADLVEMLVARARVRIRVETDPARLRPSDTPVVVGSFERLHADTGWEPRVPIERTLADLLDHWRTAIAVDRARRS
jgi:GDP-4-dehydro-6-deoxy-D-mannose reductase